MKIIFEHEGKAISEFTVHQKTADRILNGNLAVMEIGGYDPSVGFCHASLWSEGNPLSSNAMKDIRTDGITHADVALKGVEMLRSIVESVNGAKPPKRFSPLFTGVKNSPEVSKPKNLLEYAEERLDFVTLTADPDPFRYVFKIISDYLEAAT